MITIYLLPTTTITITTIRSGAQKKDGRGAHSFGSASQDAEQVSLRFRGVICYRGGYCSILVVSCLVHQTALIFFYHIP